MLVELFARYSQMAVENSLTAISILVLSNVSGWAFYLSKGEIFSVCIFQSHTLPCNAARNGSHNPATLVYSVTIVKAGKIKNMLHYQPQAHLQHQVYSHFTFEKIYYRASDFMVLPPVEQKNMEQHCTGFQQMVHLQERNHRGLQDLCPPAIL